MKSVLFAVACAAVLAFLLGAAHVASAQPAPGKRRIAQFVVWKPRQGKESQFETGYKQHLQWHRGVRDTWRWYGWTFASGPRVGQFVDATLDHAWADFDRPVSPAEDGADNQLHVYPFADLEAVYKVAAIDDASLGTGAGLSAKYVRLVTLSLVDVAAAADAGRVLARLKADAPTRLGVKTLLAFRVVDGGSLARYELWLGCDSLEDCGKAENLIEDVAAIQRALKVSAFSAMTSELLRYRGDMSLMGN